MHAIARILFIALTLTCVYGCPPSELLQPCECIDAFGQIYVECRGAKDHHELLKSLQDMAGYSVTRLTIMNSNLKHIPSEAFLKLNVSKMIVSKSAVFYLFDMPLSGVVTSNLIEFYLQKVSILGGLDWTTLENAKNLELLQISETNLEQLSESFSQITLPKLRQIQMDGDVIEYVHDHAFSRFHALANLILRNNLLTKFERKMLPRPSEIQFVDLRNNLLESFPEDIFDEMPKLNSLLLDNNRFVTLHKIYMEKIFKQLFFLSVSDNPLKCSCELSWLLQADRPFHFFGHCTEQDTRLNRQLKKLEKEDFIACEL